MKRLHLAGLIIVLLAGAIGVYRATVAGESSDTSTSPPWSGSRASTPPARASSAIPSARALGSNMLLCLLLYFVIVADELSRPVENPARRPA